MGSQDGAEGDRVCALTDLDELGNWREHRETESDPFWTPEVDDVNAYTKWDASFDRDGDGQEELLTPVRDPFLPASVRHCGSLESL